MKQRKRKRFWVIKPVNMFLMLLCILLCVPLYFYNQLAFYIVAPVTLLAVFFSGYRMWRIQADLHKMVTGIGRSLTDTHEGSLINFPLPSIIISDIGEIVWYNTAFRSELLKDEKDIFGFDIAHILQVGVEDILKEQGMLIPYNEKFYRVYGVKIINHSQPFFIIYFSDVTELNNVKLTYQRKKPVVMLLTIDNYDESIGSENESNTQRIGGEIRGIIQEFADKTTGIIRKLNHDKFILIMEHQDLLKIMQERFDVLDKARTVTTVRGIPITLSIGVANANDSFEKAEADARQALDMALGRGGDQAAVKTETGYEFFGGFSKGVEKRTKVKTRMVAAALSDLVRSSENVIIMGHKYSDLDAIGSAVGIAQACSYFNRNVNIAVDMVKSLADSLLHKINTTNYGLFVQPDDAADLITEKTLLIVVDTHTAALLESEEIYKKCKQVVVIDHHRKVVNHISDAVIFYHEPYASSTAEMVTELVQYMGDDIKLSPEVSEALLSGIMLDTKNFIIKTGVRTFEAAAYLRRAGADTVEVRKLFASTMDAYQRRSRIIASAETYKGCAIATCDFTSEDLRVVAPQAADELLGISGVAASFVLFVDNDVVNINARSMGDMNVQVLMEKLGGGGHYTMAGAQIKNSTCDKVRQQLLEIIDEQLAEIKNI